MSDDRTQAMQAFRGGAFATVEFASLLAVGGAAALLGWAILTPTGDTGATAPPPASTLTADLAALRATADPFQRASPVTTSAGAVTASAEGFTLHATRAMGLRSSAILSADGIPQASYAIGDTIGDATLIEVGPRHVELERAGRRIRIAFPEPAASTITTPQQNPGAAGPIANTTANRAELINAMALKSVQRPNGQIGFEIVPRGNPDILHQAGLEAGDIVTGVNGATLTTQNFTEHRTAIMSGASVEIRIERAGQIMTTRLGD